MIGPTTLCFLHTNTVLQQSFQAIIPKKEAEDLMKVMEKCGENLGIDTTSHGWDSWTLFQLFIAVLVLFIALVFEFLYNGLPN